MVKLKTVIGSLPDLNGDCLLRHCLWKPFIPVFSENQLARNVHRPTKNVHLVNIQEFLETKIVFSSNPSSIYGEEFNADLDLPLPITKLFPANLDIMEKKKAEITAKW